MKNLLLIILLAVSSTVYSQEIFRVSGTILNKEFNVTYANIYKPSLDKESWVYYCSTEAYSKNNSFYNVSLPIKNEVYLVEFIDGDIVKQLYISTPEIGEFTINVDFSTDHTGVIFYDDIDSVYNYDFGPKV